MFTHPFRYLFILLLALFSFGITELCEVYKYFGIAIHWYHALLTIFAVTLFTWEGSRIVEPYFADITKAALTKVKFLSLFFAAGNIITIASVTGIVFTIGHFIYHLHPWQLYNPVKLNLIYGFLINLLFHLINAVLLFFMEYRQQWIEAEELRRINSQAQMQLIKSQIKPHFLFNNLNVLSGMVIKDNPDANRFIEEFSKVYRYILSNHEKELVSLQTELDFIEPYTFLLKKRFDDSLAITIDVPENYRQYYIVPAALQMLIENAFKHNIVSKSKPLNIHIHANGGQSLVIENNLQLRSVADSSTRIGLQNIHKRYELISGRNVIVEKTDSSFSVTLPLLTINNAL